MKWTSLVCVSLDTWWSFIGIFCVEEKGRTREMELWTGGLGLIIDCKKWMRIVYRRRWKINPSWIMNKPVNRTHSLAERHFLFVLHACSDESTSWLLRWTMDGIISLNQENRKWHLLNVFEQPTGLAGKTTWRFTLYHPSEVIEIWFVFCRGVNGVGESHG